LKYARINRRERSKAAFVPGQANTSAVKELRKIKQVARVTVQFVE
jgi:hypothetical protein